jgi:glycerophosphoryl diester phosphodiesterase
MKTILNKDIIKRVIIQSFDFRTLQYLHHNYPAVKTAMLIEDFDKRSLDEQLTALRFMPTIYSPNFIVATKERIDACHKKGMLVVAWTVNDVQEMKKLIEARVDGIITDYPDLFSQKNSN